MRAEYPVWILTIGLPICVASPGLASGDFPHASCKTWNGTIVAISGVNTRNASMTGIITPADVQEYCERDPGAETVQFGGKLTTAQCVERYFAKLRNLKLLVRADCARATVEFHDGDRVERVRLPAADTSCASGNPPMIEQFIKLCPTRAKQLNIRDQ